MDYRPWPSESAMMLAQASASIVFLLLPLLSRVKWLNLVLIVYFIVAIELTIYYNKSDGVHDLGATGQLIPFAIGILGLGRVLWRLTLKLVESRDRYRDIERRIERDEGSINSNEVKIRIRRSKWLPAEVRYQRKLKRDWYRWWERQNTKVEISQAGGRTHRFFDNTIKKRWSSDDLLQKSVIDGRQIKLVDQELNGINTPQGFWEYEVNDETVQRFWDRNYLGHSQSEPAGIGRPQQASASRLSFQTQSIDSTSGDEWILINLLRHGYLKLARRRSGKSTIASLAIGSFVLTGPVVDVGILRRKPKEEGFKDFKFPSIREMIRGDRPIDAHRGSSASPRVSFEALRRVPSNLLSGGEGVGPEYSPRSSIWNHWLSQSDNGRSRPPPGVP